MLISFRIVFTILCQGALSSLHTTIKLTFFCRTHLLHQPRCSMTHYLPYGSDIDRYQVCSARKKTSSVVGCLLFRVVVAWKMQSVILRNITQNSVYYAHVDIPCMSLETSFTMTLGSHRPCICCLHTSLPSWCVIMIDGETHSKSTPGSAKKTTIYVTAIASPLPP